MRRWIAIFLELALLVIVAVILYAAFTNPDFVPQTTDQVRNIIGPAPVAFAENIVYDAIDRYNQWAYRDQTTPGYWSTPAPTPAPTSALNADAAKVAQAVAPLIASAQADLGKIAQTMPTAAPALHLPLTSSTPVVTRAAPHVQAMPAFHPTAVQPLYPRLAAPGEGEWLPMPNVFDPTTPLMFKTFLHPDPERSYARLAVVALDATRLRLHVVAGTQEPVSPFKITRTGLIPPSDFPALVAAFNGGFRAIHGAFGMMVNGQTLLPVQKYDATIAFYRDGSIDIAPWNLIQERLPYMLSLRQTPPYLAYDAKINPALVDETSTLWGSTVDHNTVIWRSAVGLSADHHTLFYGAGQSLTARRLAEGMVAAGASAVAELDVNTSYERFLTYDPTTANFDGTPLLTNMVTKKQLYTYTPAPRDFFYLTLTPP